MADLWIVRKVVAIVGGAKLPEGIVRVELTIILVHKPHANRTTKMRPLYDNYLIFLLSQPCKKVITSCSEKRHIIISD